MNRRIVLVDIGEGLTLSGILPSVALQDSYSARLIARGGVAPYTYAIVGGALPDGLMLDAATGVISGTASAAGAFGFTARVTDIGGATSTRSFSISVVGAVAAPIIIAGSAPDANNNVSYSFAYEISGGTAPYTATIIAGALPNGVALDPVTGRIYGVPTMLGAYAWTLRVTDAVGAHATHDDDMQVVQATGLAKIQTVLGNNVDSVPVYIPRQAWSLVVGDIDKSTGMLATFANNNLVASGKVLPAVSNVDLRIGGRFNRLRGRVWGAGVANGALTAAERSVLWGNGAGVSFAELSSRNDPAAASLWNKIIYAWQLDDSDAATCADAKGHCNLTKSGTVGTITDPRFGKCSSFTNAGDLSALGYTAQQLEGSHISYFAWVYPEILQSDSFPCVISRYEGNGVFLGIRCFWQS